MRRVLTKALERAPLHKASLLSGAAKEIRQHILKTEFPKELELAYTQYLDEFEAQLLVEKGDGLEITLTSQTNPRHQVHGTVKNREGATKLLRQLFALFFEDGALHTRLEQEDTIVPATFPILVQYTRPISLSGTASCFDPETKDETVVVVRAHHHEKSTALHGSSEDVYRFDTKTGILLSKAEVDHHWSAKKTGHQTPRRTAAAHHADEVQLSRLAKMVKRAQTPFNDVKIFHWCLSGSQLVLSGVGPLEEEIAVSQPQIAPLLWGIAGNLGLASGPVRIIHDLKDLKKIEDGDVVVLEHIPAKYVTELAGVGALICESGHAASDEAHSARQLGVPAVLGAAYASITLREGHMVTVDGSHGMVYAGQRSLQDVPSVTSVEPITGTKLYGTVRDLLDVPADIQALDGIGVLRSEQILQLLGVHPMDMLRKGIADEYVQILAEGIERIARAVYPRPVVYQLHDLGNVLWSSGRRTEPNPRLGYRGAHRLLKEPETLELEMQALNRVLEKGLGNVQIMVPMARSLEEIIQVTKLLKKGNATYALPEKLWVRCETPSLAIQAEELAAAGPYGVLFDVPALSTLIAGLDGENYQVGHQLDHADEAVLKTLEYAIATCRKHGVVTSLVAEGEMIPAEVVETAVRAGVTAVCVEPLYALTTHGLIASIEQRMLVEHVLED